MNMSTRKYSCPGPDELEQKRKSRIPTANFPRVRYLAEKFSKLANNSSNINGKSSLGSKIENNNGNANNKKSNPTTRQNYKNTSKSNSEEADDIVFLQPTADRKCCSNKDGKTSMRSQFESEVHSTNKPLPGNSSSKNSEDKSRPTKANESMDVTNKLKVNEQNSSIQNKKYLPNPAKATNSNKYKKNTPNKVVTSTPNNSQSDLNFDFGSSLSSILSDGLDTSQSDLPTKSQKESTFKRPLPVSKVVKNTSSLKEVNKNKKIVEMHDTSSKTKNRSAAKTSFMTVRTMSTGKDNKDFPENSSKSKNIVTQKKNKNTNVELFLSNDTIVTDYNDVHESAIPEEDESSQASVECESITQLLHPDWRKVPWRDYFGWKIEHQSLLDTLKLKVQGGKGSIYYKTEDEYEVARINWYNLGQRGPFLDGPWVTSVIDMLAVIEKENELNPPTYGSLTRRNSRRKRNAFVEATCYDAESEG